MEKQCLTFDPELSVGFGIGCREVNSSGHVHTDIIEDQHVFGSFLFNLHVLKQKEKQTTKSETLSAKIQGRALSPWKPYRRLVQSFSLQFPVSVDILLGNLSFKPGCLCLSDLHTVQGTDNLDITLCGESTKPLEGRQ